MPKLKTHKGVAKRFKMNKKGTVMRGRAGKGHILTKKSRKRKRALRRSARQTGTGAKHIKRLLPYG
mgnify:CR=1 FL=1